MVVDFVVRFWFDLNVVYFDYDLGELECLGVGCEGIEDGFFVCGYVVDECLVGV